MLTVLLYYRFWEIDDKVGATQYLGFLVSGGIARMIPYLGGIRMVSNLFCYHCEKEAPKATRKLVYMSTVW